MLFIHKKTGEILELLITSVEDAIILPIGHAFPIGGIAMIGNIEENYDNSQINENFEFLGFL